MVCIAETNGTHFDFVESESKLVSNTKTKEAH